MWAVYWAGENPVGDVIQLDNFIKRIENVTNCERN